MANPAKIPPKYEPDLLRLAADGKSIAEIAAWLDAQGVTTSASGVKRLLKRLRAERAEVSRAVTVEHLGRTVISDLDHLEKIRAEAAERAADCLDDKDWVGLKKLEVQILDRKLHYSGAGNPDDPAGGGTLAGLFAQLERR